MQDVPVNQPSRRNGFKFVVGGFLIVAAILYLAISSLAQPGGTQYFLTVDELISRPELVNMPVRVSGVVLGDTIQYDPATLDIRFTIANIPADNKEVERLGGLAKVLHDAALDNNLTQVKVVYNGPKPDLLKNEAQAILTGKLDAGGVFYAEELLLKCPTRYEEAVPLQAGSG